MPSAPAILQRALARFGRIEHRRIELIAEHLTETFKLTCLCSVPLALRDILPVHLGNGRLTVRHADVAFQPDKRKRRNNNQQQQKLHQSAVGANEFKHGRSDVSRPMWAFVFVGLLLSTLRLGLHA